MKICLDAGHTKAIDTLGDPGAVNGKYWESIIVLDIVKELGAILESLGIEVIYTRISGKPHLTLSERCRIANDKRVDCFISVHLNSASNKQASGIETLRYHRCGERTKQLAYNVQNELIKSLGWKDRGVKERSDLYVLKHTVSPAVLVEAGFISNDEECKKLLDKEIQHEIANAISKGIITTFKDKI